MAEAAEEHLINQLRDVHALEEQAKKQLDRATELINDDEIAQVYHEHREETEEQQRMIQERLDAHEVKPSAVRDLTMRSGAIGLRQLADVAPDTPVKLAMHFYAFEHLEVAAYETLARIAKEADDTDTAEVAQKILEQERAAAEKVCGTFDRSVELQMEIKPSEEIKKQKESAVGEEVAQAGGEEAVKDESGEPVQERESEESEEREKEKSEA